ncbi:Transcriptional repressor NrdR [Frankliniella fusca]|uniref:Transcriptional repressor NrdR n=1 Tax=Frankliniella fusca TaxID=407009 RepID=A0AAE1LIS7_9NEOP|nr:Transcriptional repressor NrdR [Frankliniella fusca]
MDHRHGGILGDFGYSLLRHAQSDSQNLSAWNEGDSAQIVDVDNTQLSEVGQGRQESVDPTVAVNAASTSNRTNSKRPLQDATNTQQAKRAAVAEPNVKCCRGVPQANPVRQNMYKGRGEVLHDLLTAPNVFNFRILESCFNFLASCTVDHFPSEIEATYHAPSVPKTKESDAIQPRGILYDKYLNNLKFLRLHGMRGSVRSKQSTDEDPDVATPQPEEKSALEWLLKLSLSCQEETVVKWKLLDDFCTWFDGRCADVVSDWKTISVKSRRFLKVEEVETGTAVRLIHAIPKLFKQPLMQHPTKKLDNRRPSWKPNTQESVNSLLMYVKRIGGLESCIERTKSNCAKVLSLWMTSSIRWTARYWPLTELS